MKCLNDTAFFIVQDQLNISRTKVSELENRAQEQESLIAELTSQIELHQEKNENLVLELSALAAEKQKLVESGRNQQDGLVRQVSKNKIVTAFIDIHIFSRSQLARHCSIL